MSPVIIDVVIAAILIVFVIIGAKRGMFRALAGLVILVLAIAGAHIAAKQLSAPVGNWVTPRIEQKVNEKMDKVLDSKTEEYLGSLEDSQMYALLDGLGLSGDLRDKVADGLQGKVGEASHTFVSALVESIVEALIYGVLFLPVFIILLIVLNLVAKALDIFMKLPVLRTANALLGGVIGFAEGVLLLYLAVYLLPHLGVTIPAEWLRDSYILNFFMALTSRSDIANA